MYAVLVAFFLPFSLSLGASLCAVPFSPLLLVFSRRQQLFFLLLLVVISIPVSLIYEVSDRRDSSEGQARPQRYGHWRSFMHAHAASEDTWFLAPSNKLYYIYIYIYICNIDRYVFTGICAYTPGCIRFLESFCLSPVSGFHEVTRIHCLRSHFLSRMSSGLSTHFCAIC